MLGLDDSTPTFEKVPILKVCDSQSDFALKTHCPLQTGRQLLAQTRESGG